MQAILVSTTCTEMEDAQKIAQLVLTERLAACVQISGPVTSAYWWDGEIAQDQEIVVQMKSERSLFPALCQYIKTVHPYEVPELVATDISAVDAPYQAWLNKELHENNNGR